MARPCVEAAAAEAGVPVECLTTHADLFPSLGDVAPYNEVVCLKDGIGKDDPVRHKWEDHLWRCYHKAEHPEPPVPVSRVW